MQIPAPPALLPSPPSVASTAERTLEGLPLPDLVHAWSNIHCWLFLPPATQLSTSRDFLSLPRVRQWPSITEVMVPLAWATHAPLAAQSLLYPGFGTGLQP